MFVLLNAWFLICAQQKTPALVTSSCFYASARKQMASLQILKSRLSPISRSQSDFCGKSSWFCSESDFEANRKRILRLNTCGSSKNLIRKGHKVRCRLQEGDNKSSGEEPPESLFMKELRRRGMTPTSLLEDNNRSIYELDEEMKLIEDEEGFSKRNSVSADFEKGVFNQRDRSMALNSEGLEGLIPRAKLLLTIGGTFFFGFWPLILIAVTFFSALYLYFGQALVHDASTMPIVPPQYFDPYTLLEDERISQTAPDEVEVVDRNGTMKTEDIHLRNMGVRAQRHRWGVWRATPLDGGVRGLTVGPDKMVWPIQCER
ncbi:uncharacterized protein LOC131164090 [Malania oleifera]|uniref:uncharacterized protein LOC131164090 n=1 Tax=Malania oleifera TaxID=397392 RepID=UPI0025AEBF08|nr:uncharacterized protein LOC131164090 [Malania oleifera]